MMHRRDVILHAEKQDVGCCGKVSGESESGLLVESMGGKVQCSPMFSRTDPPPFPPALLVNNPHVLSLFKLHAKCCHIGATLLEWFPQKNQMHTTGGYSAFIVNVK